MGIFKSATIELPLEILSKLWVEKTPVAETPFENCIADPDLKKFVQKYIHHFNDYDHNYLVVFKEIIKTLERFEPIRTHSLKVAEKTYQLLKEQGDSTLYSKAIIAALAHDIGEVIQNIPTGDHIMNSSNYIAQLLTSADIKDKSITFAVTNHHAPIDKIKEDNPIAIALNHSERELTPVESPSMQAVEISNIPEPEVCENITQESVVILPPGIENHEFDIESLMTKQEMVVALSSEINHFGFDAFCFKDTIYVAHKIVKNILLGKEKCENGIDISNNYMAKHFGVKASRYKLRFETAKLKKNWYFAIPISEFAEVEIKEDIKSFPRDNKGRWLAGISLIKEGESGD